MNTFARIVCLQTLLLLTAPSLAQFAEPNTQTQSEPSQNSSTSAVQDAVLASAQKLNQLITDKKYNEGIKFGLAAYNEALTTLDENDTVLVELGGLLSYLLGETGAWNKAFEVASENVTRLERRHGADSVYLVPSLVTLAVSQSSKGRLANFTRALTLQKKHKPDDTLAYAEIAKIAGRYLSFQKTNRKEGTRLLREALELYKTVYGDKSVEIVQPLMWLGESHLEKTSYRASKRLFDRAINISKKSGDRYLYADQLYIAGSLLLRNSFSSETESYLKKAHKEFDKLLGPDGYETAKSQLLLSEFYIRKGKAKQAEPGLLSSLNVFQDNPDYRTAKLSALSLLVESYELQGKSSEATPYCQAIGKIKPWNNDQEVQPIYKRAVKYPATAVRNGDQGYVVAEFSVDENGFVQSPVVVDHDGPNAFKREALRAIAGYRYAPRFTDGKPVVTPKVTNRITFRLAR